MALLWAAGIAAASLALALATRGPAVPDGAKGKPAPQQLLSAGEKAAPLRASAGALRRPLLPLLLLAAHPRSRRCQSEPLSATRIQQRCCRARAAGGTRAAIGVATLVMLLRPTLVALLRLRRGEARRSLLHAWLKRRTALLPRHAQRLWPQCRARLLRSSKLQPSQPPSRCPCFFEPGVTGVCVACVTSAAARCRVCLACCAAARLGRATRFTLRTEQEANSAQRAACESRHESRTRARGSPS